MSGCVRQRVQANWYIEWHLDSLTLWALASSGELSKAEELLKGLKSRWEGSSSFSDSYLLKGNLQLVYW